MRRVSTTIYVSFFSLALGSYCLTPISAIAQVSADRSLSTTVDSSDALNFRVTNGDRAGNNLFHSFQEFSVPNGGSVNFNNASDVENIFSRVTGGNISQIEGAIQANGSANLLLINPAGIVFGENASLNIGGSFFGTTAESLLFPEGEFEAVEPAQTPLLTISRPIGLRFGESPRSIINRSGNLIDSTLPPPGLQVQPGRDITLAGGEIQLEGGFLTASGGKIELGSVGEAAQVDFVAADSGNILQFPAVSNFNDIIISDLGRINTGGLGGGAVRLQGRNIILSGGAKISSDTFGSLPGQNITIAASESLQILGTTDIAELFEPLEAALGIFVPVRSSIAANTSGSGDAGNIAIDTKQLILKNGGQIRANTVFLADRAMAAVSPGRGGNITVKTQNVDVQGVVAVGEGEEDVFGLGRLGVELNGVSSISTVTVNSAQSGRVIINTEELNITNGGVITTATFAEGVGGDLEINAGSINVVGISPSGTVGSSITTNAVTAGRAGNISLDTDKLTVRDGAIISAQTSGTGRAGNLTIDSKNLLLNNGILSAATQAGDRGNINVINGDTILLRNNSQITTNATNFSTGGDINLAADIIVALNNSDITAIAEGGRGGNIQITTRGLLLEPDSEITAASDLGIDGTITFNTPEVDPTAGIFLLPDIPLDAESILAQDLCRVENETVAQGSSFIVTGRGGLTPTSADPLDNLNRLVDWASESDLQEDSNSTVAVQTRGQKPTVVRQSQGLMLAEDGSLWLTADSPQTGVNLQNSAVHPDCQT